MTSPLNPLLAKEGITAGCTPSASCTEDTADSAAALLVDLKNGSSGDMAPPGPKARTTVVLALAFVLERLDEMLLSAVYQPLGAALHASPSQLGALSLCRALLQALVSPLSGLLGDNLNRIHLVAAGTLLWGGMAAAIGMATTLSQAAVWASLNGVGLALVVPAAMAIVADYHLPEQRGRAFGFLFTVAALGGMAGGFFATAVSSKQPAGIEGWRFAFFVTAGAAIAAALLLLGLGVEPRLTVRSRGAGGLNRRGLWGVMADALGDLGRSLGTVCRIRSFQVVVLQGFVGGMPWNAIGFATMYLQLLGFTDVAAASLTALFWGGTALGNILGGLVGDLLVKPLPNVGRQLTCQMSIATGLPLAVVLLKALPVRDGSPTSMDGLAPIYGVVMFAMGTLVSWPATQTSCIFAEVVPASLRSSVYAFDRCFEGAVSALSAPLVGVVAERCFGYVTAFHEAPSPSRQLSNARALGSGLLVCLVVPWALQLLAFTLLYATFPHDRDASIELERQCRLAMVSGPASNLLQDSGRELSSTSEGCSVVHGLSAPYGSGELTKRAPDGVLFDV